jgi:hypothetical protein
MVMRGSTNWATLLIGTVRRVCMVIAIVSLVLLVDCSTSSPRIEGYRIVSFDSKTGQWIVVRTGTFDGEYRVKRMTVVCDFYKWGNREPVIGKDACDLRVGRMMIPSSISNGRTGKEFLDIYEMSSDRLAITEGDGPDRISQQFVVLKQELLEPK